MAAPEEQEALKRPYGPDADFRVDPVPPARRIRGAFMRLALATSVIALVLGGGTILLDQWISGRESSLFLFGTACLILGLCIGIFAFVNATGLAISVLFRDEPEDRGPRRSA
jgi:hypothetical protein